MISGNEAVEMAGDVLPLFFSNLPMEIIQAGEVLDVFTPPREDYL